MNKTISLSKYLGVDRTVLEEKWVFDSILWIDTKLFIDPKLLEISTIPEFKISRDKIFNYFTKLLKIIKQSDVSDRLRKIATEQLAVPEPKWLSIGYGSKGDKWTAIHDNVARDIIRSAIEILSVGIEDPELVELLWLFVKGFWPDSMSDLTAHIIYDDLCVFTQRICNELWIPVESYKLDNGNVYLLPKHPFRKHQIIFIPNQLLRSLPIATSWEEIDNVINQNKVLRNGWNDFIKDVVLDSLKKIQDDNINIESAKRKFSILMEAYKTVKVGYYDLKSDEKWYYQLSPFVESQKAHFDSLNTTQPKTQEDLIDLVKVFIKQFQRAIESNGWANLLYHRTDTWTVLANKPHHEDVAQKLFYMLADQYCHNQNIMLSWESHAWLGHVDFALWIGYDKKVVVEIKKSKHWNIIHGFETQLPAYIKSENAIYWFYVVIELWEQGDASNQLLELKKLYPTLKSSNAEIITIDGKIYPSPSKLNL